MFDVGDFSVPTLGKLKVS